MRQLFPSKFCWRGTVAAHRRHSHSSSSSSLQEKILASTITQGKSISFLHFSENENIDFFHSVREELNVKH